MLEKNQLIELIDLLMSEYGWEYSKAESFLIDTPFDLVSSLIKQISKRKLQDIKIQAFFIAVGTGAILSGDKDGLKNLLENSSEESYTKEAEEISASSAKGTLKTMWVSMGRKPEDFEEAFAKGKIEF